MIELKDVHLSFVHDNKLVPALNKVSLVINEGEIFGVLGQSGSGKSTLLRTINGLLLPQSGYVRVDQQDINGLSRKEINRLRQSIGFVFQEPRLLNNLTIRQNLQTILKIQKKPDALSIEEALTLVGLLDKIDAYPSQLSGGQKQRVAIARAILNNPKILLLDEPTSALDEYSMLKIAEVLREIHKQLGVTMVLVSHQITFIKALCHKVGILNHGRVVEIVEISPHQERLTQGHYHEFVMEALL